MSYVRCLLSVALAPVVVCSLGCALARVFSMPPELPLDEVLANPPGRATWSGMREADWGEPTKSTADFGHYCTVAVPFPHDDVEVEATFGAACLELDLEAESGCAKLGACERLLHYGIHGDNEFHTDWVRYELEDRLGEPEECPRWLAGSATSCWEQVQEEGPSFYVSFSPVGRGWLLAASVNEVELGDWLLGEALDEARRPDSE